MRHLSPVFRAVAAVLLLHAIGCNSTGGLGLWPQTFPLLPQAKEFASQARLPTDLPIEGCKTVLPHYFIEPGDELLIEPVDYNAQITLPADQTVMIDGTIDLGEYGRVIVAGMTVEQIEDLIVERVESVTTQKHAINVRLLESNAAVVYVLGAVSSPGAYPLNGHETVLDGILKAGGLNSNASPCDIVLNRPTAPCDCRVVLPICYRQITQMGDTTTNYQLQPGDRIYVGARGLREELTFWKQNQTCERCCNSRCAASSPRVADYSNPLCSIPAMPPLPFIKKNDPAAQAEADKARTESTRRDRFQLENLPLEQLQEGQ